MSDRFQRYTYDFSLVAMISFVFLTAFAMFAYPGGTNVDPHAAGYLFAENFFSDLGRYRTFNGESKLLSLVLFVIALFGASIAMVLYFVAAPQLYHGRSRFFATLGSIPGIVSGICFAGVAFTPWDISGGLHGYFVKGAFLSFLGAVYFYALAIFKSAHTPNFYGYTFLSYSVILMGYLYLLFFGPSAKTPNGLVIQAVGQKIVAYSQILCMVVQIGFARRYLAGGQSPDEMA